MDRFTQLLPGRTPLSGSHLYHLYQYSVETRRKNNDSFYFVELAPAPAAALPLTSTPIQRSNKLWSEYIEHQLP